MYFSGPIAKSVQHFRRKHATSRLRLNGCASSYVNGSLFKNMNGTNGLEKEEIIFSLYSWKDTYNPLFHLIYEKERVLHGGTRERASLKEDSRKMATEILSIPWKIGLYPLSHKENPLILAIRLWWMPGNSFSVKRPASDKPHNSTDRIWNRLQSWILVALESAFIASNNRQVGGSIFARLWVQ